MKLDLLSAMQRGSIEIVRVHQEQQAHLLPVPDKPLCDFDGHLPAHAESADVVRSFRLQFTYLAQITLGHRLRGGQVIAVSIQAAGLKAIERIVRTEMPCQLAIDQDVAAASMHAKERRLASSRLNRN